MPPRVKQLLIWIVVIFLLYWMISNPSRAADSVQSVWDFIAGVFSGMNNFFHDLAT